MIHCFRVCIDDKFVPSIETSLDRFVDRVGLSARTDATRDNTRIFTEKEEEGGEGAGGGGRDDHMATRGARRSSRSRDIVSRRRIGWRLAVAVAWQPQASRTTHLVTPAAQP